MIGILYMSLAFAFFAFGGLLALGIRAELWEPGLQVVVSKDQYNQLFTMHGTIMLLMFGTPLFNGFANFLVPLQIGAVDMAFPRLNMFALWLTGFGSVIAVSGFLTPQGAASFGWTAYAPLSDTTFTPGLGGDLWVFGLALQGFGTILGSVNIITTIITMRMPGMTMFRMPIFTWNALITGVLVLMAFPPLASALLALGADRRFEANIFNPENGGPILWQHLFWFFGHPEVYVLALPFFGIVTEIIPAFSQTDLRVQDPGGRHDRDRRPVRDGVGPPHVHPRYRHAGVLRLHDDADRGAHGREVLQLDRHHVEGIDHLRDPDAVHPGLPDHVHLRRVDRRDPVDPGAGLPHPGHLLRGRPLPLRHGRDGRVRDVRGLLFLVAEDVRPQALREHRQGPFLVADHRFPHDLPDPALARGDRSTAPVRELSRGGQLRLAEPRLDGRCLHHGRFDPALPAQRGPHPYPHREDRGRRPLGLRCLPGVGDLVPAAAAQLPLAAANPLRAACLRPAPSRGRRTGPHAGAGTCREREDELI